VAQEALEHHLKNIYLGHTWITLYCTFLFKGQGEKLKKVKTITGTYHRQIPRIRNFTLPRQKGEGDIPIIISAVESFACLNILFCILGKVKTKGRQKRTVYKKKLPLDILKVSINLLK